MLLFLPTTSPLYFSAMAYIKQCSGVYHSIMRSYCSRIIDNLDTLLLSFKWNVPFHKLLAMPFSFRDDIVEFILCVDLSSYFCLQCCFLFVILLEVLYLLIYTSFSYSTYFIFSFSQQLLAYLLVTDGSLINIIPNPVHPICFMFMVIFR